MEKVIVTRHPNLILYLSEISLVEPDTPIIDHATVEDIKGKDVIGILPMSLAVEANTITEVPLKVTKEMRESGRELTLEEIRQIAGKPTTYKVTIQK